MVSKSKFCAGPFWESVLSLTLVLLLVSISANGQVVKVVEGAAYGPVIMLPETEVVFGYTILCAADLPYGSDPCPNLTLSPLGTAWLNDRTIDEAMDESETGQVFDFGALNDLSVEPLTKESLPEWGAVAPLGAGDWALYARLVSPWSFSGEVSVRADYGPPSPTQAFVPLGAQPIELMRFDTARVDGVYVEIKVVNGYSIPLSEGYLLGVEFRVDRVR